MQHLQLPLDRSSSVAAHGRHDKRFGTQGLQMLDRLMQNQRNICDAAAACRNGDRLTGLDMLGQIQTLHLLLYSRGEVIDSR